MEQHEYIRERYRLYLKVVALTKLGCPDLKRERCPNFPEVISETLVKYAYETLDHECTSAKGGDVYIVDIGQRVEVKASGIHKGKSTGPTSFGPTERWDKLVYVDCTQERKVTIYEVDIPSDDSEMRTYKVSKTQTFDEQCVAGRRPRFIMSKFIESHPDHVNILYAGSIRKLLKAHQSKLESGA